MKRILTISLLFILFQGVQAQVVLDRVLIGAGHTEFSNGSFNLSASVGEPISTTVVSTNLIITQGFQQSNYVLSNPLIADLKVDSAACVGANDGAIEVTYVSDEILNPTYQWSNGDTGKITTGLVVGVYHVTITGSNGKSVTNSARISPLDSVDCLPGFYTGITPNGDNFNDYWHIDNADFFAKKEVQVFNRYGAKVWETTNYENLSDAFNGNHQNGQPLPDGTYYYVAKFDQSTYKGWIEISR